MVIRTSEQSDHDSHDLKLIPSTKGLIFQHFGLINLFYRIELDYYWKTIISNGTDFDECHIGAISSSSSLFANVTFGHDSIPICVLSCDCQ